MLSLVGVLLELNLYIILASSLSVSQSHVRSERISTGEELYSNSLGTLQPAAMTFGASSSATNHQPPPTALSSEAVLRDNKMDDLFLETPSVREHEENEQHDHKQHQQQMKHNSRHQAAHYNTINLDNSLEFEPEMMINNHNHQSYETPAANASNSLNPNQNSRHYNSYQASSSGSSSMQSSHQYYPQNNYNLNHHHQNKHHHQSHHQNQQQHYGKYSPNMFANNYNLNYIHGFLTNKPSLLAASSSPSSPSPSAYSHANLNGNSFVTNQYNLASSPAQQQTNGFVSSYISASSTLSAAVSNLQQTIAQKQQQLASINNQLQSLASGNSIAASFSSPSKDSVLQDNMATHTSGSTSSINNNNNNENDDDSSQSSGTKCGRQQVAYREPRVVGGNSTYEGEFPWAVSIQRHGNHHCGGVIVDRRWILTAAHCVRSQLVGNLAVRTGGHTLSRSSNGISSHLEKDYQVEQIVMHDDFSRYDNLTASQLKSSANTNNADIALLKLKHDIHWNDLAWPVCFPDRDAGNFSGHDAIVIGWGKLNEKSEEFSNELQKVKLTIIDNKVCQNWFRQAGRDMPIDDRIICAGFKHGGKDACHGDSGGPLLSRINGQYVVVGVVSTGIGCARPLLPGLYSRVSSYINWIERYITI